MCACIAGPRIADIGVCHSCSMLCWRVNTRSGSSARRSRSLNSERVRSTVRPSIWTTCRARSMTTPPKRTSLPEVGARSSSRRRGIAGMRKMSFRSSSEREQMLHSPISLGIESADVMAGLESSSTGGASIEPTTTLRSSCAEASRTRSSITCPLRVYGASPE